MQTKRCLCKEALPAECADTSSQCTEDYDLSLWNGTGGGGYSVCGCDTEQVQKDDFVLVPAFVEAELVTEIVNEPSQMPAENDVNAIDMCAYESEIVQL